VVLFVIVFDSSLTLRNLALLSGRVCDAEHTPSETRRHNLSTRGAGSPSGSGINVTSQRERTHRCGTFKWWPERVSKHRGPRMFGVWPRRTNPSDGRWLEALIFWSLFRSYGSVLRASIDRS
jgi:hypothetical protein